jgi:hypothetical protein
MKAIIIIFMVIGSYAGSFIPLLWGASVFSPASIIFGGIGGFAGIYVGYKFANRFL